MNVSDLIDPSFSYRLIATLMHFLWQGCLVALLAVVGDGLLSRASACRRYALHVAALAIMVACVAITFSQIEFPGSASTVTVETMAMTTVTEPIAPGRVDGDSVSMPSTATPAFVGVEPSLSESHPVVAVEAVESPIVLPERSVGDRDHWHPLSARAGYTWAPQIALLYFACCGLLLARLIRGTWVAHRLRRMSTTVSDDSLIATLQRQSTELGLRVLPRIAWCAEVSIPLVIGVLKPMILLPAAAATGLSPDQLQALITHELAHIRRYDLLVNLVQRVVESMLFFHPAVWFISRRISNEREQACDELVLSTGCERLRYADALVRMAELSSSLRRLGTSAPATSLAASGANSSEFKRRVLKVLSVPTASQLRPSRIALLAIVALILGVTISASRLRLSAFAETQPQNAEDSAGRGSPDPALDPTAGLPDSDKESNSTDNANGDLRSSPAAGSGDPRRARDLRRAQEIEAIGQPKPMWCQPIKAPANAWPSEVGPLVVDERRVIIGEHVLDLRTGESLGRLTFGDFSLDFLRLSANRRYLLACGTHPKSFEGNFTFPSTLAEVWDLTTLKRVGSAFQVPHSIYDGHADVSPDGKVVVSGSREDVVLFDVATGKEINKLDVKSRRIDAVGFSPDGRWLVVSNQNDLTYWKWRTTEKPQTLHVGRTIISLAFSPDSRYLAEGPDCQVDIEIRDLQTLKVAHALRDEFGSPLYVKTMCFSSDGKRFIASNDVGVDETKLLIPHRLLAWELPTGRLKAQGSRPSQYGWGMGATPGGFYAVRANESNGLMAPTWVLADNTAGADTPTAITPKPDVEWGPAVNGLKARAVPVLSSMSEDAIDPAQRVTMFERPEDVAFVVELENVSDKPIKLLNTRNGNGVDNAKGKANSDWFGQFLFSVDLFDENGKLIEQPDVKVVDLDLALVGHQVATVEPGKLHRFLLRPARWSSPFKLPLDAGRFRAAVRYHGLSDRVTKRMKDYRPDSPQLTAISGDITAPATTFAVRTFNGRSKRSVVKRETDPPRDGNDGSQAVPFDELVWGQPVNGLRAAMSFLPLQETHAHGEKPAVILHLQNVGTQPLTLLSKLSLPNAIATIKNDKGEPINLDAAELLGERLNGLISLKPQQIVVLDAGSLGLAVTQERAN
ncbi:MAG: M56 family metallopeptidase, partial [Planctomycetaceae bacterium]